MGEASSSAPSAPRADTRIMTAPFEDREGWEMSALALDGSVYLEQWEDRDSPNYKCVPHIPAALTADPRTTPRGHFKATWATRTRRTQRFLQAGRRKRASPRAGPGR